MRGRWWSFPVPLVLPPLSLVFQSPATGGVGVVPSGGCSFALLLSFSFSWDSPSVRLGGNAELSCCSGVKEEEGLPDSAEEAMVGNNVFLCLVLEWKGKLEWEMDLKSMKQRRSHSQRLHPTSA